MGGHLAPPPDLARAGAAADVPDYVQRRGWPTGRGASRAGLPVEHGRVGRLSGGARAGCSARRARPMRTSSSWPATRHNAWAFELAHAGETAGVEFAGPVGHLAGVRRLRSARCRRASSPAASVGAQSAAATGPTPAGAAIMAVELTPAQASCEWRFVGNVRQRSTALAGTHRMAAAHGAQPVHGLERLSARALSSAGMDARAPCADDYHHPGLPGAVGRALARPPPPGFGRHGVILPKPSRLMPTPSGARRLLPWARQTTDDDDDRDAQDQPARRFGARDAARARPRPTSPRRSARASPRRRSRRGSTASCATSPARSRAMPSSRWSPRATRPTRSSWPATTTRTCSPRRCRRCCPARRSPSARRPTTASTTTSRRATRGPFTDEDLPAIEAKMREIIAADKPLTREVWSRDAADRQVARAQGESFKAEWAAELPEGEELTVYRSGRSDWLDMCRGPHLPSTGKLDPAGVQADARLGRLLARRPEERDAQPHLRHRLAQQEAARRAPPPAGGSGQARPPQARAARWTCSTSRTRRTAACSGTPRAT